MKKEYYVADFFGSRNAQQRISADSTFEKIWITLIPNNCVDEIPLPKLFENRSEAVKWKDKAQAEANADWRENDYIYKKYGDRKPKYKVYEYNRELDR